MYRAVQGLTFKKDFFVLSPKYRGRINCLALLVSLRVKFQFLDIASIEIIGTFWYILNFFTVFLRVKIFNLNQDSPGHPPNSIHADCKEFPNFRYFCKILTFEASFSILNFCFRFSCHKNFIFTLKYRD